MRTKFILILVSALLVVSALPALASEGDPEPELVLVASGFSGPSFVDAPSGDNRLFVTELGGDIKIIENGTVLATPFLSLSVGTSGEQGLYGMAFHPDYASNGRFFVHYANTSGDNKVVEYGVSSNPNVADATPVRTIATIAQPYTNHNGGMIEFGPDNKLYVAVGDGGSGGDPLEHGQNPNSLLGSILRFDVDLPAPYIPADNPFADGVGGAPAVFHYGVRNPWRMAHDTLTGELYVADVGQSTREEVTVLPQGAKGEDLGWNTFEGTFCFESHPVTGCSQAGTVFPTIEYSHGSDPCSASITGGYVYRGGAYSDLQGHYFYADYCKGWVKSFLAVNGVVQESYDWSDEFGFVRVLSFGTGGSGQLYLTTTIGSVYQIVGGGNPDEMFFYRDDGLFRYYNINPNGTIGSPILAGDGYTAGWSAITAVDLDGDGQDEMFFYRDDGLFRYYNINPNGTIGSPILAGDGYTTGWSAITAVDLDGDGQDEMFFYRDDGLFRYYNINPNGTIGSPILAGDGYTTGWSAITAVDLDGDGQDEMFFYRDDGLFRYYNINPNGTIGSPILAGDGYTTGWSAITAVQLDG